MKDDMKARMNTLGIGKKAPNEMANPITSMDYLVVGAQRGAWALGVTIEDADARAALEAGTTLRSGADNLTEMIRQKAIEQGVDMEGNARRIGVQP